MYDLMSVYIAPSSRSTTERCFLCHGALCTGELLNNLHLYFQLFCCYNALVQRPSSPNMSDKSNLAQNFPWCPHVYWTKKWISFDSEHCSTFRHNRSTRDCWFVNLEKVVKPNISMVWYEVFFDVKPNTFTWLLSYSKDDVMHHVLLHVWNFMHKNWPNHSTVH